MPTVLLIHYAATVFMTGVIWVIQLVHYPLFDRVGDAQFAGYEASHVARVTWVVGPPMLAEAFTALALLSSPMPRVPGWVPWVGAALLAVVWLSTAVWQVPQHDVLARGFDPRTVWTPRDPPEQRDERLAIEPRDGQWSVHFAERGTRRDERLWLDPQDAVRDVVMRLLHRAWVTLNHRYWHRHHPTLDALPPFGAPWPDATT